MYHDESSFISNDMHTEQRWVQQGVERTTTKTSSGVNMMLSAWICTIGLLFGEIHDTNTLGYWTSDLMIKHTDRFLDVMQQRFKACDITLMLDNR